MESTEQDGPWMTAAEIAELFGVSPGTVSRWRKIDEWPESRPKKIRGVERDAFSLPLVSLLLASLGLPNDDHPKRRK